MRIKKLRASFGALQNDELVLEEGLNLICAPNEGGKSTWSAFLRAMLYGINTKERDRQGFIAEKKRYQPWSGAAMEGTAELVWQGKDITLRRGPKGSVPFGKFEAVYTGTAEPVPGLTGENCGETLTGVPREVYERSAFVGQGRAAIDGSPALEARVSALVSSGEEDVSYSQVERRLRDWRNRRQHNKTGLIPKLEGELSLLEDTLSRQAKAHRLAQETRREMERLEGELSLLEGERDLYLSRAQAERRRRYEAAQADLAQAQEQVKALEEKRTLHGAPPSREALRQAQEELNTLNTVSANRKLTQHQAEEARQEAQRAAAAAVDPVFSGLTAEEAGQRAAQDAEQARQIPGPALWTLGLIAAGLLLAVLPWLLVQSPLPLLGVGLALAAVGGVMLALSLRRRQAAQQNRAALLARYEASSPEEILTRASSYRERQAAADQAEQKRRTVEAALAELTRQQEEMKARLLALTHTFAPNVTDTFGISAAISRALGLEEQLTTARVRLEGAQRLAESLPRPDAGALSPAAGPEPRFDPAETAARLSAAQDELARLRTALATAQGELNTLGDPDLFRLRREELLEELARRREEYEALTLALEGLEEARASLQARFSPALNQCAGEILGSLTGGKYDQVTLTRQFEALAQTREDLSPRRALTLSQGTADQLYLAVRLAVCRLALAGEEPVPLVLDDALANFDDGRCALALDFLARLGREQQILLFTCHSREEQLLSGRTDVEVIPLHSPGK